MAADDKNFFKKKRHRLIGFKASDASLNGSIWNFAWSLQLFAVMAVSLLFSFPVSAITSGFLVVGGGRKCLN